MNSIKGTKALMINVYCAIVSKVLNTCSITMKCYLWKHVLNWIKGIEILNNTHTIKTIIYESCLIDAPISIIVKFAIYTNTTKHNTLVIKNVKYMLRNMF